MNTEALMKMRQARSAMLVDAPFFGELALKLTLKEDMKCSTMWTDGKTLGYGPDFVLECDMPLLKFAIMHEAGGHCAMLHHLRRDGRDIKDWNVACDYAVNAMLKKSGYAVPSWALYRKDLEDKSADEIFGILKGEKEQEPQRNDKSDKNENKEQDNQQSDDAGNTPDNKKQGDTQTDTQTENESDRDGKSGNASDEDSDSQNESGEIEGGCGEVRDYPDGEADVKSANEQEWKQAIAMAEAHAEQAGKMPGYAKVMVEDLVDSKVDWKEVLQRFISELCRDDYTWKRPNSRYTHTGFILPSLYTETLPPLIIAIDTSGSITQSDLKQFASEMEEILSMYNTTLHVVHIDTEVRHTEDYSREDMPVKLEAHGGGGTKFSPLFEHVNNLDETPLAVVYLTDLQCKDYGPEPDYPVLWIKTSQASYYDSYYGLPPFGEVTEMYKRF